MFTQHVVHATPFPYDTHDEDDSWEEYDDQEHSDHDTDTHEEDTFDTEWHNNMQPTLLAIRSIPPGHLHTRHEEINHPSLLTFPTGSPNTPVLRTKHTKKAVQ